MAVAVIQLRDNGSVRTMLKCRDGSRLSFLSKKSPTECGGTLDKGLHEPEQLKPGYLGVVQWVTEAVRTRRRGFSHELKQQLKKAVT